MMAETVYNSFSTVLGKCATFD